MKNRKLNILFFLLFSIISFSGPLFADGFTIIFWGQIATDTRPTTLSGLGVSSGTARDEIGLNFYSMGGSFIGTPTAGDLLFIFPIDSIATITLPENLAYSKFKILTNPPTATAVFTLKKNGALLGNTSTVQVSPAGTITVITSATTLLSGDYITFECTTPASLQTIGFTFRGTF